jgi:hypothetical protein
MNDEGLKHLVRSVIRPVDDLAPHRDLWPRMVEHMHRTRDRWSMWDWVAVAASGLVAIAFPEAFTLLLYGL